MPCVTSDTEINADGAADGALEDLRAEFPGWRIEAGQDDDRPNCPLWRASRDNGRGGPLGLGADSYGRLRELLDEMDAVDCRHAIYALRDALRARGLSAEALGLTVSVRTRAGILRVVAARRGVFAWSSGVELGPIDDPDGAADRMMPGLGMRGELDA